MPYHRTDRYTRQRAALARQRRAAAADTPGEAPPPWQPPRLRRVVIVIDFDFGAKIRVFRLFRTARIDSYRVQADHKPVPGRV